MRRSRLPSVARQLLAEVPEADLLEQYLVRRDDDAFAQLLARYDRFVWALCRNLLGDDADAEDAFQATFLTLARSAKTIRPGAPLGPWLHGVAFRVCKNARRARGRRAKRERAAAQSEATRPVADSKWDDAFSVAADEVQKLPDAERTAFVLCYLEGRTAGEAAALLGVKPGAFATRLTRAKQKLWDRLAQRGFGAAALAFAGVAGTRAVAPAALVERTLALIPSGMTLPSSISVLMQGVTGMTMLRYKSLAAGLVIATGLGLSAGGGWNGSAVAQVPGDPGTAGRLPHAAVTGAPPAKRDPHIEKLKSDLALAQARLAQAEQELRNAQSQTDARKDPEAQPLDPNSIQRIHSRLAGEIVAIGTSSETAGDGRASRGLRVGDRVGAGQLLAVVLSKELGEKKSDFVDAVAKLKLDETSAARVRELCKQGATSEKAVRDAERAVEVDRLALDRIERTLLAWRLTEADLARFRSDSDKLGDRKAASSEWAHLEVRARPAGVLLEKNVAVGDFVDTSTDLFKIGGLGAPTAGPPIGMRFSAHQAAVPPTQESVPTVLGPKAFCDGDVVEITDVRATSAKLEPGDSVTVRGRVRLASQDQAKLCLYVTQTEGDGREESDSLQEKGVKRGLGEFEIKATIRHRGVLHLTLYDKSGKPFGGVYFGTSPQMKRIADWSLDNYLSAPEK